MKYISEDKLGGYTMVTNSFTCMTWVDRRPLLIVVSQGQAEKDTVFKLHKHHGKRKMLQVS